MARIFRPVNFKRWTSSCGHLLFTRSNSLCVSCRTSENDPLRHTSEHEARFYGVPSPIVTKLFQFGGIPKSYVNKTKSFRETCFMVRKPALEIINYMKIADYSRPAIRYVLYGQPGNGKSLTLAHVLHYGLNSSHLIVHVPWVPLWFRHCKDYTPSTTNEGFIDTPLDAAQWLGHFKTQNEHLLKEPNLTISKEYVWSKREVTASGASLMELINLGINRLKYASDVLVALIKEIKHLSSTGRCKTLVAIDGYNAFFYNKTEMKDEDNAFVPPSRIRITEAFLDITQSDWSNGSVVLIVDRLCFRKQQLESNYPFHILGKEGLEHLDPFVPVHVPKYSDKEFHSCIDYYVNRLWLQNPKANTEEGRKELLYLSVSNPYELMKICGPL